MAVLRPGVLLGDRQPAFVGQVIELVNGWPPIKALDICHACFPGFMVGVAGPDEWKEKLAECVRETDIRMQVLHMANYICRKEIKSTDPKNGHVVFEPRYYIRSERFKIQELAEELEYLPFFEIKPGSDPRFPSVRDK